MKETIILAKRSLSMMVIAGAVSLAGSLVTPMLASAGTCSHSSNTSSINSSSGSSSGYTTEFDDEDMACVKRSTVLLSLGYDDGNGNPSNVQVCHIPQNEPEAEHTIIVDQSAVPALVAQGDSEGLCPRWISESDVDALPTCTTSDGTSDGIWTPQTAMGNGASLNAYFHQVKNGMHSGLPDTMTLSYREINAQ